MRFKVDWENNAEEWWSSARRCKKFSKKVRAWLNSNGYEDLVLTGDEAKKFLLIAEKLSGWFGGPNYAKTPLIMED